MNGDRSSGLSGLERRNFHYASPIYRAAPPWQLGGLRRVAILFGSQRLARRRMNVV
jgi:hypothetical protein